MFRPGTKARELKSTAITPIGEKKVKIVYSIPSKYEKSAYEEKCYRYLKPGEKRMRQKLV